MKEFSIHFGEERMEDLRRRIGCTRLPKALNGRDWRLGTDDDYLQSLLEYWCKGYDWTHKEIELNRYPQFTCELGPGVKFCVSDFRQSQEWRWKAGRILA